MCKLVGMDVIIGFDGIELTLEISKDLTGSVITAADYKSFL